MDRRWCSLTAGRRFELSEGANDPLPRSHELHEGFVQPENLTAIGQPGDKGCLAPMGSNAGPRWRAGRVSSPSNLPSRAGRSRPLLLFALACSFFIVIISRRNWQCDATVLTPWHQLVKNAAASSIPALTVFQVYQPVLTPNGLEKESILTNSSSTKGVAEPDGGVSGNVCTQTLMRYSFANSYGNPFIGLYTPPSCSFNRVTVNLTVTSKGRQFDRLGLMYLGDVEVFRTSTAEPTANGIQWTYIKDMSHLLALFKSPQKLIFDLGNLIDSTYTAPFNTSLTATFFNAADTISAADEILPVSARKSSSNAPSAFTVPMDNATSTLTFPRNVRRALFTLSACGQADEEFWWSNVLSSNTDTFVASSGPLYGFSPFREVQLLIDGRLAGVAWPFAVIFTGGVAPGFWRPVVGIDAFDLREREIDITPWLPLLCDGNEHDFEIRVAGITDDGKGKGRLSDTVGDSWVVTGKVFIWLDEEGSLTSGSGPVNVVPVPTLSLSSSTTMNNTGANETLQYEVRVRRHLSVNSTIMLSNGTQAVSWTQDLDFSNTGMFTDQGAVQATDQITKGLDHSSSGYATSYNLPLAANTTYTTDSASGNFSTDATINRGLNIQTLSDTVLSTGLQSFASLPVIHSADSSFTGTALHTTQNGSAHYESSPSSTTSLSSGTTEQDFFFGGLRAVELENMGAQPLPEGFEIYHRHVLATNGTVVEDDESLVGEVLGAYTFPTNLVGSGGLLAQGFAAFRVKDVLGRGPQLMESTFPTGQLSLLANEKRWTRQLFSPLG